MISIIEIINITHKHTEVWFLIAFILKKVLQKNS